MRKKVSRSTYFKQLQVYTNNRPLDMFDASAQYIDMNNQKCKRILITIDQELLDRIDLVNRAAGIRRARSWLIREALEAWLAATPFERGAIEKLKGAIDG